MDREVREKLLKIMEEAKPIKYLGHGLVVKRGRHICERCGGEGFLPIPVDNGKCFECGGDGISTRTYVYETEEYKAWNKARIEAELKRLDEAQKVYIKAWFAEKNNHRASAKYDVSRETEKAFLLRTSKGQDVPVVEFWCPKSATMTTEEYAEYIKPLIERLKELRKKELELWYATDYEEGLSGKEEEERVNIKWQLNAQSLEIVKEYSHDLVKALELAKEEEEKKARLPIAKKFVEDNTEKFNAIMETAKGLKGKEEQDKYILDNCDFIREYVENKSFVEEMEKGVV